MTLAPYHRGIPATMPIGSWCMTLYTSNGLLRVDPVYRCPCGLIKSLWRTSFAVDDDGHVTPDVFCGSCRYQTAVRLLAWDPDPC